MANEGKKQSNKNLATGPRRKHEWYEFATVELEATVVAFELLPLPPKARSGEEEARSGPGGGLVELSLPPATVSQG